MNARATRAAPDESGFKQRALEVPFRGRCPCSPAIYRRAGRTAGKAGAMAPPLIPPHPVQLLPLPLELVHGVDLLLLGAVHGADLLGPAVELRGLLFHGAGAVRLARRFF